MKNRKRRFGLYDPTVKKWLSFYESAGKIKFDRQKYSYLKELQKNVLKKNSKIKNEKSRKQLYKKMFGIAISDTEVKKDYFSKDHSKKLLSSFENRKITQKQIDNYIRKWKKGILSIEDRIIAKELSENENYKYSTISKLLDKDPDIERSDDSIYIDRVPQEKARYKSFALLTITYGCASSPYFYISKSSYHYLMKVVKQSFQNLKQYMTYEITWLDPLDMELINGILRKADFKTQDHFESACAYIVGSFGKRAQRKNVSVKLEIRGVY